MLKGKGLVIPLIAMMDLFSSGDRACKSLKDGPIRRVDVQLHKNVNRDTNGPQNPINSNRGNVEYHTPHCDHLRSCLSIHISIELSSLT